MSTRHLEVLFNGVTYGAPRYCAEIVDAVWKVAQNPSPGVLYKVSLLCSAPISYDTTCSYAGTAFSGISLHSEQDRTAYW